MIKHNRKDRWSIWKYKLWKSAAFYRLFQLIFRVSWWNSYVIHEIILHIIMMATIKKSTNKKVCFPSSILNLSSKNIWKIVQMSMILIKFAFTNIKLRIQMTWQVNCIKSEMNFLVWLLINFKISFINFWHNKFT